MPTPQPIPFWTQAADGKSKKITAEKVENWYLEKNPQNAKYPYSLLPTPGLSLLATVGTGPHRGCIGLGGYLFVVSGDKLYKIDKNMVADIVGHVHGLGNVLMTKSGDKILIASNDKFYCADSDSILELPDNRINGVAYQDGYGIATKSGTNEFYISNLDDLTTWSGVDYSTADAKGDKVVGLASVNRVLWILKERTIEAWQNTGAAAFPFERNQSGFMEIGCLSPYSIAVVDNQIFWLGDDHKVYTASGFQPQEISTPRITQLIENEVSPHTASAFVYSQSGHTHYVLSFSDMTIVYDSTTGLWHYRKSMGVGRWRANCYSFAWGKHIVGDYDNGKLYELTEDAYDEDGEEIRREAVSPPISSGGSGVLMHELFVDMKMGVGLDGKWKTAMTSESDAGMSNKSFDDWTAGSPDYWTVSESGSGNVSEVGDHEYSGGTGSGAINLYASGPDACSVTQTLSGILTVGAKYRLRINIQSKTGGGIRVQDLAGSVFDETFDSVGEKMIEFTALYTSVSVSVGSDESGAIDATIGSVELFEVSEEEIDPKMLVSWSDDGGETFGNEVEVSIGKIGRRQEQARINRLGFFRERCIKIAISDPVEAVVVGAYARMEAVNV